MDPTPAQHRTATLAAEWASEVAPRLRSITPNPSGTIIEMFARAILAGNPIDELTILFYETIESVRTASLPWQPDSTGVREGEPRHIGLLLSRLLVNTMVVALPFDVQRRAIPEDFVCLAEEVATDFSECVAWFLPERRFLHGLLMERQLQALLRADSWLGSFSGQDNAAMWTDDALRVSPHWARARELAKEALALFAIELSA